MKINSPTIKEIIQLQIEHHIYENLLLLFALSVDSGKATVVKTIMEELNIDKETVLKFSKILNEHSLITEKDYELISKLEKTKIIEKEDFSEEIEEILRHLGSITGSSFKIVPRRRQLMEQWLKKGSSIESFKIVNLYFSSRWGRDPQMQQYLRPETLYNTKFLTRVEEAEVEFKIIMNNKNSIEKIYAKYLLFINENTLVLPECFDIPMEIQKLISFWLKKGYSEENLIIAIEETIKSWRSKEELIPFINIIKILDQKFPDRATIAIKRRETTAISSKSGISAVEDWLKSN